MPDPTFNPLDDYLRRRGYGDGSPTLDGGFDAPNAPTNFSDPLADYLARRGYGYQEPRVQEFAPAQVESPAQDEPTLAEETPKLKTLGGTASGTVGTPLTPTTTTQADAPTQAAPEPLPEPEVKDESAGGTLNNILHPTGNAAIDMAVNQNPLLGPLNQIINLYPQVREMPVLGDVLKKGEEVLQGYQEHIADPTKGLAAIAMQSGVAQIPGGERADIFSQGGTTADEMRDLMTRPLDAGNWKETLERIGEIGRAKAHALDEENPVGGFASSLLFDPLNFVPGANIGGAQKFRKVAEATGDITKVAKTLEDAPLLAKVWDWVAPLTRAKEGELLSAAKLGIEEATGTADKMARGVNPLSAFQKTPLARAINFTQRAHDWILPQAADASMSRAQLAKLIDTASEAARNKKITPALQQVLTDSRITDSADFQRAVNGALDFKRPQDLDAAYTRAQELAQGIDQWTQTQRPTIQSLRETLLESRPFVDAFDETSGLSANYRGAFKRFANTLDNYEKGAKGVGAQEVRAAVKQLNSDIEQIGKMELASAWVDNTARVVRAEAKLPDEIQLADRIMNKIRAYESTLLLATNPHYVAQNIVSDWTRLALFGVNPMESSDDIARMFGRAFGTDDVKTILGNIGEVVSKQDPRYTPNFAYGSRVPDTIRNLPGIKQLGDFNQALNERSRVRAFATGFRRAMKANWKYGTTIPALPEQLAQAIRARGGERALKSVIKKLENSFNAQEMRDALTTPFPMWEAYADAIAPELNKVLAQHGFNFNATPEMVEYLIAHGTGDAVNEVLANALRRAQTEGVENIARILDEEQAAIQRRNFDWRKQAEDFEQEHFGTKQSKTPEEAVARANEAATNAPVPPAANVPPQGVPMMVTREMERRLKVLGYDEAAIRTMKPQEAQDILREGRKFTALTADAVMPSEIPIQEASRPSGEVVTDASQVETVARPAETVAPENLQRVAESAPRAPTGETVTSSAIPVQESPTLRTPVQTSSPVMDRMQSAIRSRYGTPSFDELPPQDIRRYVSENPALNVVDEGAWDYLLGLKKADGTPRYTPEQLATWKPETIERAAIFGGDLNAPQPPANGYASSTFNDFMRLFETKTGKDPKTTGNYFKNLLNAEIKRKAFYDEGIAAIKPFESWDDVRARPHEAYQLLRRYNEYPTLAEGEFKVQLRLKMIEDNIPDELQDGVEAIYDALANTAAKRQGVDVDTFWTKNFAGIEGSPTTHQLRGLQQVETNTPEFRKWFGNSKVVDAEGKPLVVFHGTQRHFDSFDAAKNKGINPVGGDKGFYFTPDAEYAAKYAQGTNANIVPVHLKIENPKFVRIKGDMAAGTKYGWFGDDSIAMLKARGHDGVVVVPKGKFSMENAEEIVVFDPTQIKSAIGNRGTFDPTNPNILEQGAKGATDYLPDGRRLLRFFKGEADASTYLHEAAHTFLPTLDTSDLDEVAKFTGLESGEQLRDLHLRWVSQDATMGKLPSGKRAEAQFRDMGKATSDAERYVIAQEKFARGFEKYIAEGVAPTEGLARAFEQFKDFLLEIYRGITGSEIDLKLTDEMRALYGRMLDADQVISPSELKKIQNAATREVRGDIGAPHLAAGFFDGFFQHGIPESKKIWQYTKATEGMPNWWYPISNGKNIGTVGGVRRMPPFVSSVGPNKAQLHGTSKKDWKLVNGSDNPEWSDFVLEHYREATGQQLDSIDDLLRMVNENVEHNSPARTLYQKAKRAPKGQMDMFASQGRVDDLPLFSGTPTQAKESAFVPQEVGQQGKLFSTAPEFGGQGAKPKLELEFPNRKETWEMSRDEYIADALRQGSNGDVRLIDEYRLNDVERALKQSKPVPAEVLADYPELAAKYGKVGRSEGGASLRRIGETGDIGESGVTASGIAQPSDLTAPTELPAQTDTGQFTLFQDVAERLKDPTASTDPNLKADLETAMANELLRILKPYIEADIQNYGRALDPITNELIEQYLYQVEPHLADMKRAATQVGRWYHERTTMDYSQRWNVDDALSYYAPFTFYPLHMAANIGQDFLDKPALFAMYTHAQNEIDQQTEGLPDRFKHRIKIPMPFLPEWMGDGIFFDPFATAYPARQVFNLDDLERATWQSQSVGADGQPEPLDNVNLIADMYSPHVPFKMGYQLLTGDTDEVENTLANLPFMRMARGLTAPFQVGGATGVAPFKSKWDEYYWRRELGNMVGSREISPEQMRIALLTRKGAIWETAVNRAAQANYTAPIVSGWSGFTGKVLTQGEQRYMQARTLRDQLRDQLLAEYGANPNLTPEQAYEFLSAKGEYGSLPAPDGTTQKGKMRELLDTHPELERGEAIAGGPGRTAQDDMELYREYLTKKIWEAYRALPELQKKVAAKDFGDEFQTKFLNTETRDMAGISEGALAGWANALGIDVPRPALFDPAAPEPTRVFWADEGLAERYQQWHDGANWEQLNPLLEQYFKIPEDAAETRKQFVDAHPQLKQYWDSREQLYDENPELVRLLMDEPAQQQFYRGRVWDAYFALPRLEQKLISKDLGREFQNKFLNKTTRDYDALAIPTLQHWIHTLKQETGLATPEQAQAYDAYYANIEQQFGWDNIGAWGRQYNAIPSDNKEARKQFRDQNPRMVAYWDARDAFFGEHPDIAKLLGESVQKYFNPNAPKTTTTSRAPKIYNEQDYIKEARVPTRSYGQNQWKQPKWGSEDMLALIQRAKWKYNARSGQ